MGYNFKCDIVIDGSLEEEETVGAGWVRNVDRKSYTVANLFQGRGRTARFTNGWYYTLSRTTYDELVNKGVVAEDSKLNIMRGLIVALFGGSLSTLRRNYPSTFKSTISDEIITTTIQAAFAFGDRFGREPAALFCGLNLATGLGDCYPIWQASKGASTDDKLWQKHLGTYEPPKIEPKNAENILLLMINTYLERQKDITNNISIGFTSPLIQQAGWKLKDKASNDKIRSVLNTIIENKLKAIESYKEDKVEYSSDEETEFDKVVKLLKVIKNVKVQIEEKYEDKNKTKPKKDWGINISYDRK
jgi:hypothetical protein